MRSDVAEFLLDPANGVTDVIIVGGTTVVPASVEAQLSGSFGLTVDRLAGSNRAGTAVAIADRTRLDRRRHGGQWQQLR